MKQNVQGQLFEYQQAEKLLKIKFTTDQFVMIDQK